MYCLSNDLSLTQNRTPDTAIPRWYPWRWAPPVMENGGTWGARTPWCYRSLTGVTRMVQVLKEYFRGRGGKRVWKDCYSSRPMWSRRVIGVIKGCYRCITGVLQVCYCIFPECFRNITEMSWEYSGCYRNVIEIINEGSRSIKGGK